LDIKVRGQSLEPVITLNVLPWNDVPIDGSILGTYLTVESSDIVFDDKGNAEIKFCSDAQAVYLNYSDYNQGNPDLQIGPGKPIYPVGIEPADPVLAPGYDGQVLLDKQHCGSFRFQIDTVNYRVDSIRNVIAGDICIKAGNIIKCLSFIGRRVYDAHFIVGETLLGANETFTAAFTEGGSWLEVSPHKYYDNSAVNSYAGTATQLYLHLDENLTGATRSGVVTATGGGVVKKVYISQLPALPVGPFGSFGTGYGYQLYTEQIQEERLLQYKITNDNTKPTIGKYEGNDFSLFDQNKYFDYKTAEYSAYQYCASKNRQKISVTPPPYINNATDFKWFLPAKAQLMGLWVTYNSYWNKEAFPLNIFWSSSNNEVTTSQAYYVNFTYGNAGYYYRNQLYGVRCVRAKADEPIDAGFITSGTNAIIDFSKAMPAGSYSSISKGDGAGAENDVNNQTLYIKLEVANADEGSPSIYTHEDAMTQCAGRGTGWRLPTQREQQAIWILQQNIRAIQGSSYQYLGQDYYWSATDNSATYPYDAWTVFGDVTDGGNAPNMAKTQSIRVRCVREVSP
jgi:hypothetical protein